MSIVEITQVAKSYPPASRGAARIQAVNGVSLSINEGEIFAIIGYSGAGKSTLARLINGLERIDSGQIFVDGQSIPDLKEKQLRKLRQSVGMIFQQFNLFTSKTVAGNIDYALSTAGWEKDARKQRIAEVLDFVGLLEKAWAYPNQLSGGQKQRVGIARALATRPKILLADEATSALDPETTGEVASLLSRINRELGTTIVLITHEMDVVRSIAHRAAVMEKGEIVELADTASLFLAPKSRAAKNFVATVIDGEPHGEDLARLRERHPGRLVTVKIPQTKERLQERVFSALGADKVSWELVHGGVVHLQDEDIAVFTFNFQGLSTDVDALIASLKQIVTTIEVGR